MGRKQNQSAESVWRDRLARFRNGKLTVAEFCRHEGVSNPSFYQWRRRLDPRHANQVRRSRAAKAGRLSFVPVKVSSATLAEVEFPNGVRIRVPATDLEALRAVIEAGNERFQEAT